MKMNFKTLSVMALAGLMVLGSCKKNEQNTNNNGSVLYAGIEQLTSNMKTTLDPGTGVINWTAGDKIMVNNGSETAMFNLVEGEGGTIATFNGPATYEEAEENYVAAFPAEYVDNISGTTVTFNIPSEQTPNTGNPMVACGADENLTFSSVLSGIIIKLQGNGAAKTINKLVLTSNKSEKLWGTYTFDANNGTALTYVDGGDRAVTLNLPDVTLDDGEEYTTCVMVPAGSLTEGFSIEILYNDLSLRTVNTSEAQSGSWSGITMLMNNLHGTVTYKYPADVVTPGATNATLANQQQLSILLSQVEAGSYTGKITLNAGTPEEPATFDFGGTTLPNDEQVVIAAGSNVEVSNLEATVTSASSGYPAAMIISDGANATLNNVTVTSTSTHDNTRALNILGGAAGSEETVVTLNNCTIDGGTAGYSRGLNTYSDGAPVTINVVGGEIYAGHYAINIPNDATNNALTINLSNASVASGWAALNIWGSNNTINATNCTLKGTNDKTYNAEGWNDFATIAFNNNNVNCAVNLVGCDIIAEATTGNEQYVLRMYSGGNSISFDNACTISKGVGNPNTPNWYCAYTTSSYPTFDSNFYMDDATFDAFNAAWGIGGSKGSFKAIPAKVSETESSKK